MKHAALRQSHKIRDKKGKKIRKNKKNHIKVIAIYMEITTWRKFKNFKGDYAFFRLYIYCMYAFMFLLQI